MRGTLRILRAGGLAFALGVAAASAATITIVSPVAHAQDFRGTISGKISDSSGGRNIYFNGDLNSLKADYTGDKNDPVFDISGFYFHDAAVQTNGVDDPAKQRNDQRIRLVNNMRYFPSRVPGIRWQGLNLWDISAVKQVRFSDRVRAQFHVELINAFNHPIFTNPNTDPTNVNFGKVTVQANLPRDIQLAAKIIF